MCDEREKNGAKITKQIRKITPKSSDEEIYASTPYSTKTLPGIYPRLGDAGVQATLSARNLDATVENMFDESSHIKTLCNALSLQISISHQSGILGHLSRYSHGVNASRLYYCKGLLYVVPHSKLQHTQNAAARLWHRCTVWWWPLSVVQKHI